MAAIITANFDSTEAQELYDSWASAGFAPASEHPPHVTLIYTQTVDSLQETLELLPPPGQLSGTVGGGLVLFDTESGVAHCASVNINGLTSLYNSLRGLLPEEAELRYDLTPHCTIMFGEDVDVPAIPKAVDVNIKHLVFTGDNGTMSYDLETGEITEPTDEVALDSIDSMSPSDEQYVGHVMSLIAAADTVTPHLWEAVLAVEGEQTPDGRILQPGSMRWREGPLTLMMNFEAAHGGQQGGSQIVGVIEEVWRDGFRIMGRGRFDTSAYGQEAYRLVSEGIVSGISIDLSVQDAELIVTEEDAYGEPVKVVFSVVDGIILTATITPIQALDSAKIMALEVNSDGMCVQASEREQFENLEDSGSFADGRIQASSDREEHAGFGQRKELVAAAGREFPSALFAAPDFDGPTHITVDDDGRIYGHIARWSTCHIGVEGLCTTPPPSFTDYSFYRVGQVKTENGGQKVGLVTMNTGHADQRLGAKEAIAHYDDTSTIAAYVNIGEDAYGIWISGVVSPALTEVDITNLSACSLSGDWRLINGNLELVALLAVNVPGFPVAVMASGQQTALVSAGYFRNETIMETEEIVEEEAAETLAEEVEVADIEVEELQTVDVEELQVVDAEDSVEEEVVEESTPADSMSAMIELFGELVDQVGKLTASLESVEAWVSEKKEDEKRQALLAAFTE